MLGISRLTWDGTAETKFSGANVDREIFMFPVQLTTSRIGDLIRLIRTLLYVMTTYIYIYIYIHIYIEREIESYIFNRVRLPILLVVSWTGKMSISLSFPVRA